VAREIPTGLSGSFFESIEIAWEALGEDLQRDHLGEVELEHVESRLRPLEMFDEGKGLPLLDAWRVSAGGAEVTLCLVVHEYSYEEHVARAPQIVVAHDCYMAAHFALPEDVGKVLM